MTRDREAAKRRVSKIIKILERLYPDAETTLDFRDPLQLLVSTILAAQATDVKVNEVTGDLYKKYRNAEDFANADVKNLEQEIKPLGFFRDKSRNIIKACKMIVTEFGGRVPDNMDDMLKLPGVGRKTANLVLGDVYGIPGIVVDTHCKRLANRIGLTKSSDPVKIEKDLMGVIPENNWNRFCHKLVYHGRAVCRARKPICDKCDIAAYCDFFNSNESTIR